MVFMSRMNLGRRCRGSGYEFRLAGMKGRPNGGGLFMAAMPGFARRGCFVYRIRLAGARACGQEGKFSRGDAEGAERGKEGQAGISYGCGWSSGGETVQMSGDCSFLDFGVRVRKPVDGVFVAKNGGRVGCQVVEHSSEQLAHWPGINRLTRGFTGEGEAVLTNFVCGTPGGTGRHFPVTSEEPATDFLMKG